MNDKILKIEVLTQMVVSSLALLACLFTIGSRDFGMLFFSCLAIVGLFNIIGFILRLLVKKSKLNFVYLGLLIFFAICTFGFWDSEGETLTYFVGITGIFLNIFYIGYGYKISVL